MRSRFAVVAALALAGCQATETPEQAAARMQADTDSARTAITAAMASFQTHFNAGHSDSLGTFYAENAVAMPPNTPAITGRAAIVNQIRNDMSMMPGMQLHFTIQNVSANGDMAVERGRYHMTANMGGQAIADSGKYLAHWHKMDGRWLMVEDIWNSDAPAAPPPPASRRN